MKTTIWSRAQSIVTDESAIVAAPGDESSYIVKSSNGKRPHYVRPSKSGGFMCDSECLGYTAAKICSHTVAAGLKAGKIGDLVMWYQKMKCKPNLTSLAESGKPASVGKKPRKGVTKKVSETIQSILASAEEHYFTSRLHNRNPVGPSKVYFPPEVSSGPSNAHPPPEVSAGPSNVASSPGSPSTRAQ